MIDQSNWYQSFFNGLAVEMWHQAVPAAITQQETGFIKNIIGEQAKSILDVACGSGRHTLALASLGYNVTAIDISADNIELLNRQKKGMPVTTLCGDVLTTNLPGAFDAAICMGNSFSYFPFETMTAFATKVRQALNDGGKFIINSASVAEDLLPNLKPSIRMQIGDILFEGTNNYLQQESLLETKMRFTKNGIVEEKTAYHFVFSLNQVKTMLSCAGFKTFQAYGSADATPYVAGTGQLYLVAQ